MHLSTVLIIWKFEYFYIEVCRLENKAIIENLWTVNVSKWGVNLDIYGVNESKVGDTPRYFLAAAGVPESEWYG